MFDKKRLLILGTGSLARELAEISEDHQEFDLAGFVVNEPPYERDQTLMGKPVYWIDDLASFNEDYVAVCGLVRMRKSRIIDQVKKFGIPFTNFIYASADISKRAIIGTGVIIKGTAHINQHTHIGDHVVIDCAVKIGEYVNIGEYSVIHMGTLIAGYATVGSKCYIGMGSLILDRKQIGDNSIIGAGSLVTRDVPANTKAFGHPARIIEPGIQPY